MDQSLYTYLFQYIRTKKEANNFSEELQALIRLAFKPDKEGFSKALETVVSTTTAKIIKEVLAKLNYKDTDNEKIRQLLHTLQLEVNRLKSITIYTGFPPRESTIDKTAQWVRTNIAQGIVVDIQMDKSVIGGAIIEYSGRYQSYTIAKQIEEMMRKNVSKDGKVSDVSKEKSPSDTFGTSPTFDTL